MKKKQISLAMAILALTTATVFTSCKDDDKKLPPIGGFNNSDEVASANLLAKWTFDGNQNEVISNTAPSNTYGTVNLTTGVSGQALNLTDGALVYPAITKINAANALASYTISMWVNVKNNKTAFTSFFGIFPTASTEPFGNLSGGAETGWFAASNDPDTLVLKANYKSLNPDGSFNGQDNRPDPRGNPPVGVFKGAGVWSHFVMRFTPSTHKLEVFGNNTSIGAYSTRNDATVELNMQVPAQVIIGSLASSDIGFTSAGPLPPWTKKGTFAIDNIRVYNKPLTEAEISSLYQLELAGR